MMGLHNSLFLIHNSSRMISKVLSAAVLGLDAEPIEVDEQENITTMHLAEAIQYRPKTE